MCVYMCVSFGEHASLPANAARSTVCRVFFSFFRLYLAVVSSSIRVFFLVRKHDMKDPARRA